MKKESNNKEEVFNIILSDHRLNLETDAKVVIKEHEKAEKERYSRLAAMYPYDYLWGSYGDDDWDEDDEEAYWASLGYHFDDEMAAYENSLRNFERNTGHSIRKDNKKGKITSQKFINGFEVDDLTFDEYNERTSKNHKKGNTRRGGKKHNSRGRVVRYDRGTEIISSPNRRPKYEHEQWLEDHSVDKERFENDPEFTNEEKKIIFYRNLPDTTDTYEWDNIHEFDEWLRENDIYVDDVNAQMIVYNPETHCCLNTETTSKVLVVGLDYDSLVWEMTNGDLDMLKDESNKWKVHEV